MSLWCLGIDLIESPVHITAGIVIRLPLRLLALLLSPIWTGQAYLRILSINDNMYTVYRISRQPV